MGSPCDPQNCSTACYSYRYCIRLMPLPPLHPFPPIQPNDSFSDNSSSSNQQAEIVIATFSTTVFILIVLFIIRCSRDSGARHDEPLHPPPSTLAPSTITTIQTTNPNNNSDDNGDTTHHVWLIRTVGLDDRIIKSIASSVYNGTSGHGSTECCSVCLGEFFDGEEIKLLQGCCHLFHALCIDTWLKSHVNCPLCRRPVIDGSDHSERPKQEDSVITIDSVSEFGSSSSRLMDNDDDMMPSRVSGSFDGLFSLELCDATDILILPSKVLAGQEREHIC